jgi:hypothetical protein
MDDSSNENLVPVPEDPAVETEEMKMMKIMNDLEEEQKGSSVWSTVAGHEIEVLKQGFEKFIHLPCDNCSHLNAPMTCSQCRVYQYCNQDCQKQHWKKGHKQQCPAVKGSNASVQERFQSLQVIAENYEKKKTDLVCSLCEQSVRFANHLQLPCYHIYCLNCIAKISQKKKTSSFQLLCPDCPPKDDSFPLDGKSFFSYLQNYTEECLLQTEYYYHQYFFSQSEEEQSKTSDNETSVNEFLVQANYYGQLAREEFQRMVSLLSLVPSLKKDKAIPLYQLEIINLHILLYFEKNYLKVFKNSQFFLMDDKLSKKDPLAALEVTYYQGLSALFAGKYYLSFRFLHDAFKTIDEKTEQERNLLCYKIMTMISFVGVKLGMDSIVFSWATLASSLNRTLPGILLIMSRYYREKGDEENGSQCLRAAIRYECPWKPEHRDSMKKLLDNYSSHREKVSP